MKKMLLIAAFVIIAWIPFAYRAGITPEEAKAKVLSKFSKLAPEAKFYDVRADEDGKVTGWMKTFREGGWYRFGRQVKDGKVVPFDVSSDGEENLPEWDELP